MKPSTALLINQRPFFHPDFSQNIHHELELVIQINKNGKSIDPKFAHKYYDKIGLGIDFTARDIQDKCKEKGLPWEIAKAFDNSAVVGDFLPISELPDNQSVKFNMQKNAADVQIGNSADMIYPIIELVAYLSNFFTIKQGDLIFTGTPAGVGPVAIGDVLTGFLEGTKRFEININ